MSSTNKENTFLESIHNLSQQFSNQNYFCNHLSKKITSLLVFKDGLCLHTCIPI